MHKSFIKLFCFLILSFIFLPAFYSCAAVRLDNCNFNPIKVKKFSATSLQMNYNNKGPYNTNIPEAEIPNLAFITVESSDIYGISFKVSVYTSFSVDPHDPSMWLLKVMELPYAKCTRIKFFKKGGFIMFKIHDMYYIDGGTLNDLSDDTKIHNRRYYKNYGLDSLTFRYSKDKKSKIDGSNCENGLICDPIAHICINSYEVGCKDNTNCSAGYICADNYGKIVTGNNAGTCQIGTVSNYGASADKNAISDILCNLYNFITGKTGRIVIGFVFLGAGSTFLLGKMQLSTAIAISIGCGCIFGASTLVSVFTGKGFAC